jgi:hypothetical protein
MYSSCVLKLRLFVLFNDMTLFIKKKKKKLRILAPSWQSI